MRKENTIPSSWSEISLYEIFLKPRESIVDGPFGSNLKASEYQDFPYGNVPIIRIQNVKRNFFHGEKLKFISREKARLLERHSFQNGDIVVTKLGSPLGKACIVPESHSNGIIVADIVRIRLEHDLISKKFLTYQINSPDISENLNKLVKGSTRPRINLGNIRKLKFFLAPIAEQHRIVAKIEELFSELDQGIESLKTAQAQLKTYRQAILKHAFEGKLAWREELGDDPPSEAIPPTCEFDDFDIPESWRWCRLGEFIEKIQAGKSFKCEERPPTDGEIGIAKVSAVTWGEYNEQESKTCLDKAKINPDIFIHQGDFILSRANTIELVGASVIVKSTSKRIMLSDKTLRIIFSNISKEYVLYYLRSRQGRAEIEALSTGNQESMRNIGQDRIKKIRIPICSAIEQAMIVAEIESQLSQIDQLSQTITESLQKADTLRQSILQKAFTGQLVPQDPNDEPASVLLERIRAEREAAAATTTTAPRKTGKRRGRPPRQPNKDQLDLL